MRKFIGFALLLFATAASADSLPVGQMLIVRDPNVPPNPFAVDSAQPVRGGIRFHELYASGDSFTTLPALVNLGSAPPCGAAEKESATVCADQVMVRDIKREFGCAGVRTSDLFNHHQVSKKAPGHQNVVVWYYDEVTEEA